MTQEIKRRRGTTAQHASFTGAEAELTVDTDKRSVVVHDGSTAGGVSQLDRYNHIGLTAEELADVGVPAIVQSLLLDGYSTAGIGQGLYAGRVGEPDEGGIQDASGRWFELAERFPSPLQFGAQFNGVADDTSAVLKAAQYAIRHQVPLMLPPGTGLVGELSTVGPLKIVGHPQAKLGLLNGASSLWNFDGDDGDIVLEHVEFDALEISAAGLLSFANARRLEWIGGGVRNVSTSRAVQIRETIGGGIASGVAFVNYISGSEAVTVKASDFGFYGCLFRDHVNHGIRFGRLAGDDAGITPERNAVIGCKFHGLGLAEGAGSSVLFELGSKNSTMAQCHCRNTRQITKVEDAELIHIIANDFVEPGCQLNGGTGIQFTSTSSDCVAIGNRIDGTDRGILLSERGVAIGNTLLNIGNNRGIYLVGVGQIIVGNTIDGCGTSFAIASTSTDDGEGARISNNVIKNASRGIQARAANQSIKDNYIETSVEAIVITNGTNSQVKDNDLSDSSGTLITGGGMGDAKISGNSGHVTENFGAASGTTSAAGNINVEHGLAATPTFINLTGDGNATRFYTINSINETNITVRVSDDAGSPLATTAVAFYWEARV